MFEELHQTNMAGKCYGVYRGSVIDNTDPDGCCRIRVAVAGVHSNSRNNAPIETYPWANQCQSLIGGGIAQSGIYSVPQVGAQVFVMFEGGNPMRPLYFGTAIGKWNGDIGEDATNFRTNGNLAIKGISDVPGTIAKTDLYEYRKQLAGSISDKLSVAEWCHIGTDPVKAIFGDWQFPGPQAPSDVTSMIRIQSETGVSIEIDSNPVATREGQKINGTQRLTLSHPGGSYLEMQVDGQTQFVSGNERYDMIFGNHKKWIGGGYFLNSTGDINFKCLGMALETTGSQSIKCFGTQQIYVQTGTQTIATGAGNQTMTCGAGLQSFNTLAGSQQFKVLGGNQTFNVEGNQINWVNGDQSEWVLGNQILEVSGVQTVDCKGNRTIYVTGATEEMYSGSYFKNVTGTAEYNYMGLAAYNYVTATVLVDTLYELTGTNVHIKSGGTGSLSAGGMLTLYAGGNLNIQSASTTITGIVNFVSA